MRIGLLAAAVFALWCAFASAQALPTTIPSEISTTSPSDLGTVIVSSDLDVAREEIAPSLGAVTYSIGPAQISSVPQGEDAPFQQVLLRAPGVVEDSFGQEHVRGEHANLTYRVNGVLLPEPLSGFAQQLDTHLIDTASLIDGALPAQFGFHTAGIVDVNTKTGANLKGNEVSIYGGSFDTVNPSFEFGGTRGNWDYFVTGSFKHDNLGIENPAPESHTVHDNTNQERTFVYLSYHIDETSRISLLLNGSYGDFQIPDRHNQPPQFGLAGSGFDDSARIKDSQNEQEYYSVISYQKAADKLSFQASIFSNYSQIHFNPDMAGDLVFQGVAGEVLNNAFTNGMQLDAELAASQDHTVRAGFIGDYTATSLNTNTFVFNPVPPDSTTPSSPELIGDNTGNEAVTAGVYIQDEWRLDPRLTLNYGARFDTFNSNFDNENQLSPRANLVYKLDEPTTLHAGYARYFVTPPLQNVSVDTVNKFAGTTNDTGTELNEPTRVERSNYYDAGISRQFGKSLTLGADSFYKAARNLIDEGQFGSAVIETPFNYARGYVYGAELSGTYTYEGFSAFGNFSWVEARGRDINSQQFDISPDDLAYINNHYIRLDHEANYTGSAGVSLNITHNDLVILDAMYGSGLRAGAHNDKKLQQYVPVSVGYEHTFHMSNSDRNFVRFRVDVVNVFDESYKLRNGTGIGVGAPQFGQRRGYYFGVAYDF